MSLSGNLSFVPLDEVLRLLTRSNQQGAVAVSGNGLRGRVFVGRGGIDLATTSDDSDLHRHLVNSGYAEESVLRRITTGETTLAAVAEANQEIVELLREMTVESIYQISRRGEDFDVKENMTSPYASPKSFDLEALLSDAREREKEWNKVSEVVPDLNSPVILRRDLGERDEVTIRSDDWKVLSEIGAGSSVSQIADRLGTTRFWTARVTARLVSGDLARMASDIDEVAEPADERAWDGPVETPPTDVYEDEAVFTEEHTSQLPEEHTAELVEDEDPVISRQSESWWQETDEEQEEGHNEAVGTPAAALRESDEVEEDTEAFLEKVFSELDSPQDGQDEGYGLLRRRRMGSLRDFSSDS